MRRAALIGVCLLLLLTGTSEAGDEPVGLEVAEAQRLLAKAASVSPRFLRTMASLGSKLGRADLLAPEADVPMTLAVLVLGGTKIVAPDLAMATGATTASFAEAVYPMTVQGGERVPRHERASILHEEYIQSVTISSDRAGATGTVAFRAPDAYEGELTFKAENARAGWRIIELSFARSGVRTTLEQGRWRLHLATGATGLAPQALGGLTLPRVGTLGPAPTSEPTVVISVTRAGYVRVPDLDRNLSINELRAYLRKKTNDPLLTERDGSSRLNALLAIDETTPWFLTQWLMQLCAHPGLRIYRVWMLAETRAGQPGAIATHLPKDRGLAPTRVFPEEFFVHKVKAFKLGRFSEPSSLGGLYEVLKARHATVPDGARTQFEIIAPPPKGGAVPHGFMLGALDACLAAGATSVVFEGAAMPLGDMIFDDSEALKRSVDAVRKHAGVPRVKVNNDPAFIPPGSRDVPGRGLLKSRWGSVVSLATEVLEEVTEEVLEEVIEELEEQVEPEIRSPEIKETPFGEDPLRAEGGPAEGAADAPVEEPPLGPWGAFKCRRARGSAPADLVQLWARQDAAVEDALRWLAAHQSPNGGWSAHDFGLWCDGKPSLDLAKRPQGAGKALHDVGVTGLALQAFLGAGYGHRGKHAFAKTVGRALRFLKNVQDPEGCFGPRSHQQYIYNHGMAALAMVEAFGLTGSPIFKGSAQRALDFVALSRNPYFGWRYGIKPGDNDTSVTGWMMLVLSSASLINADAVSRGGKAPLQIDERAMQGALSWLDKITDPKTGRVGYIMRGGGAARPQALVDQFPGEASESVTAVGVLMRLRAEKQVLRSDLVRKGLALMAAKPPVWDRATGRLDMYYWHWGTLAMFQAGDKHYGPWRTALNSAVLAHQRKDGDACGYRGSWDPAGPWGPDGGRVYSTALMALCLEARYRYPRGAK